MARLVRGGGEAAYVIRPSPPLSFLFFVQVALTMWHLKVDVVFTLEQYWVEITTIVEAPEGDVITAFFRFPVDDEAHGFRVVAAIEGK